MRVIQSLVPGSSAWLKSRSASKAPAIMSASKYQTRSDLLKQMATGITPYVDAATQARFDAGHASEAAAREIAEGILCDGLSPVCGESDDGYLTASFDGLTFDNRIGFEHKLWNENLAAAVRADELPEEYKLQMDQQILVGGMDYVLFMVSDGTREKCVSMEYRSTPKRAERLLAAWAQFDKDLVEYQHVEHINKPQATPAMQLPALFIQVEGSFNLTTNLAAFGEQLKMFVDRLEMKPKDDQQFADAEEAVKTLEKAEALIKSQESGALAQMGSVDEMRRTAALYLDIARTARLALEKAIKAQKDNIRIEAIAAVKVKYAEHLAGLEVEITPIKLIHTQPDWAGAIKGLRKLDTLHDALDSTLAQAKIEMDAIAKDVRARLVWYRVEVGVHKKQEFNYEFLFRDLQTIITIAGNSMEAFQAIVTARITQHKQAEAAQQEVIRAKMQADEEAKATAKAKAAQEATLAKAMAEAEERGMASAAGRAKVEAEAAKMDATIPVQPHGDAKPLFMPDTRKIAPQADPTEEARKRAQLAESAKLQGVKQAKPVRPSNKELIEFVAQNFGVSYGTACDWVIETADAMRQAA